MLAEHRILELNLEWFHTRSMRRIVHDLKPVNDALGVFWPNILHAFKWKRKNSIYSTRWPYVADDMYPSDSNKVVISCVVFVRCESSGITSTLKTQCLSQLILYDGSFFSFILVLCGPCFCITLHTITANLIKITSISCLSRQKKLHQNWHVEF